MSFLHMIDEDLKEFFDWPDDLINYQWNEQVTLSKLLEAQESLACDALLDQNLFPGVGNIIKNEVLFNTGIHPLSKISGLKRFKLLQMIRETRIYVLQFMNWKNQGIMHVKWHVHQQELCPNHQLPLKVKTLGKTKRDTYYCEKCQTLYI